LLTWRDKVAGRPIDTAAPGLEVAVGEISDAALVSALQRQLTATAARQVVAAGNLANVDTPGFRAREVDFEQTLQEKLAGTLTVTHVHHLQPPGQTGPASREAENLPARRDGNTVQIDRELLAISRAGGDFARAQTALAAKFRLVRYAIGESR
jgi:flagellar basal-body rod protein FlgB